MANMVMGGFRWAKTRRGVNLEPREERPVASGYATGIFRGDPLVLVSDGTVAVAAAGDAVYAIADGAVRFKAAGVVIAGNFVPAATTYTGAPSITNPQASIVACIPVVGQLFEVDYNTLAASITVAQGLMNNNVDVVAAAGSTSSGRSAFVLDGSAPGTATAQFRVVEISTNPMNDVTAVNWKVLGEFNEGPAPSATSAVGV